MHSHSQRLTECARRVAAACRAAGRGAEEVLTVAVSKKKPAAEVAALHAAGQRDFGENYCSEGLQKMRQLPAEGITWHFIGGIQSRAAKQIAGVFDWVHSVDRLKVAERLDRGREGARAPLNVCIQVNTSGETTKSGVEPRDAPALARDVARLGNLRVRGLMTLPRPTADAQEQRREFRALSQLRDEIAAQGVPMDTLSMGMSADFEAAIAEGATIVRIGTLLFGPRD